MGPEADESEHQMQPAKEPTHPLVIPGRNSPELFRLREQSLGQDRLLSATVLLGRSDQGFHDGPEFVRDHVSHGVLAIQRLGRERKSPP